MHRLHERQRVGQAFGRRSKLFPLGDYSSTAESGKESTGCVSLLRDPGQHHKKNASDFSIIGPWGKLSRAKLWLE